VTETDFKLEIPATAFRRPNRFERFTNSSPRFYRGSLTLVIHDINFASCYSDNIVALKDGNVWKHGKAGEMIEPQNLKEIFGIDFNIQDINNCKICMYYR